MNNNWTLSVIKYSRHITRVQFLNIRLHSNTVVRVRFAPSPTGMCYSLMLLQKNNY